jgi:hypothetical protein
VGARLRCGLVLYAGDRTHQFEDNLHTVPISALWSDA